VTTLRPEEGEIGHRWPTFIDARHFVFTMQSARADHTGLFLTSLDSATSIRLSSQYSNTIVSEGRLLFVANGMIVAQQLDVTHGRLVGDPVDIAGPTSFSGGLGFESFSVTRDGSLLAYAPGLGSGATTEIQWLDRRQPSAVPGRLESTTDLRQHNAYFEQISPDGGTMVVAQFRIATADLWLFDLRRDVLTRFTYDDATELNPVWSPDGTEMMFSSNRGGFYNIYRKALRGSAEGRPFRNAASHQYVTDWTRDGQTIVYTSVDPQTASDIWSANASGSGEPSPVLRTPFNEYAARVSPDGQWLAYASDESGEPEIYVQQFPSGNERSKVSSQGGSEPQWRADGRELFYVGANHVLMAVPVSFSPTLTVGRPVKVHDTGIDMSIGSMHGLHYTPTPDGQRFLASVLPAGPPTTIVLNWQAGLR
jgi:eukaryotic-like serine/threonine-protein kinase